MDNEEREIRARVVKVLDRRLGEDAKIDFAASENPWNHIGEANSLTSDDHARGTTHRDSLFGGEITQEDLSQM